MHKRFAVAPGEMERYAPAVDPATGAPIDLIEDASSGELPAGAAAWLPPGADPGGVMAAALEFAERDESLLLLLAEALDAREGLPQGSSQRVMTLASALGAAVGLGPGELVTLERGALLRDIGKIRISNAVLLKEGALDYGEWETIRRHTRFGFDILNEAKGLQDAAPIALRHHECFDGDGYPNGKERDDIPLAARIVKLVDVYCAMTSPRLYRPRHSSHGEALAYLQSERGKHFDPDLVDAFAASELGARAQA